MKQRKFPVFADRFSQLRGEKTQDEFAAFLGISRPTVGFYENGVRLPDAQILRQIADKCNVSADWLLGLSDGNSNDYNIQATCKFTGLTEGAIKTILDLQEADRFLLNEWVLDMAKVISTVIEEPCFTPLMEDLQCYFDALHHVHLRDGMYGDPLWHESAQTQELQKEIHEKVGEHAFILTDYRVVQYYKSSVKNWWEQLLGEMEERYLVALDNKMSKEEY